MLLVPISVACQYFRIPSPVLFPAGAQALNNGSTISARGYSVIPLTATGNVTALILSPPRYGWTQLTLINQSAFTLTFDVSGTSNVADGHRMSSWRTPHGPLFTTAIPACGTGSGDRGPGR